jgi:hypothetical protein
LQARLGAILEWRPVMGFTLGSYELIINIGRKKVSSKYLDDKSSYFFRVKVAEREE